MASLYIHAHILYLLIVDKQLRRSLLNFMPGDHTNCTGDVRVLCECEPIGACSLCAYIEYVYTMCICVYILHVNFVCYACMVVFICLIFVCCVRL